MMKINVAMVSYKNTKPFLFGFDHFAEKSSFNLNLLNPAKCSEVFANGKAEIALVPVAFLENRTDYRIITDYCIGADGQVNSVALLSNQPINQISNVILDNHSMTSNRLVKVLFENHWKQEVSFSEGDVSNGIELNSAVGVVMIGDKVFEYQDQFKYKYDLAEAWKELTGKPFVFAVWIAKPNVSIESEKRLNQVLKYGVENIAEIIKNESDPLVDLHEYLTENLKYHLTKQFQIGLNSFLQDYKVAESVH